MTRIIMVAALRAWRIQLYPNESQEAKLLDTLGVCKNAWNSLKALKQSKYNEENASLSYRDLNSVLVMLKQSDPRYRGVYAQVLQNVAYRLDKAYKSFFALRRSGHRRARLPRYRNASHYSSFTYPQAYRCGVSFTGSRVSLSKIGSIRFRGSLPDARIKTLTVKRSASGRWHGFVTYEAEAKPREAGRPSVGIDLGLRRYATLSDGHCIPVPQFYRRDEARLGRAQRSLSRKNRLSRNWSKARVRLARLHERVSDRRLDFLHKASTWIADRYGVVVVESLGIKRMSRGLRLGKSIHDASWGRFLTLLEYKVVERGGEFRRVDPRGTSQRCSRCGETVRKALGVRVHSCPCCGLVMDRDLNASKNILKVGMGDAELTPAESPPLQPVADGLQARLGESGTFTYGGKVG